MAGRHISSSMCFRTLHPYLVIMPTCDLANFLNAIHNPEYQNPCFMSFCVRHVHINKSYQQSNRKSQYSSSYMYMYMYMCHYHFIITHIYTVYMNVHVAAHFFLGKVTALGVLCCFALFFCLTLLASFFLPSHLSFKNMYMYMYILS